MTYYHGLTGHGREAVDTSDRPATKKPEHAGAASAGKKPRPASSKKIRQNQRAVSTKTEDDRGALKKERDNALMREAALKKENARLLDQLAARNRDLAESFDQQTASSNILRAIASAPGDAEGVLQKIADTAHRLFGGHHCAIGLIEGDAFRQAAVVGTEGETLVAQASHMRLGHDSMWGTAVLDRRIVHVHDLHKEAGRFSASPSAALASVGSAAAAPLVREGEAIGAVIVVRGQVSPFTDKELAVLQSFADQAVIAIENARLLGELREALERQTATSDVLGAIAASPSAIEPVFETILSKAARLCEAPLGVVHRRDGDDVVSVATFGLTPEWSAEWAEVAGGGRRMTPHPGDNLDRALRGAVAVHYHDMRESPDYVAGVAPAVLAVDRFRMRTALFMPLVREGEAIGVLILIRKEVRPFSDRQIELVENFAKQAVIAVENARLLTELRESLDRQTATADILRVIASTPGDPTRAIDTIADTAVRMFDASSVVVQRVDGNTLRYIALSGPEALLVRNAVPEMPLNPSFRAARCVIENRQICEESSASLRSMDESRRHGVELTVGSIAFTPLIREGEAIGVMVVRRREIRPFSERERELMRGFAAQAVIAIENARLLTELRESLDRQTATSEVLRVISATPGELDPVFHTIVTSAARICDTEFAGLQRYDGSDFRLVAHEGKLPAAFQEWAERTGGALRGGPNSITGQVAATRGTVHIVDYSTSLAYLERDPLAVVSVELIGIRTVLGVPIVKGDELLGLITVYRREVRPFTEKQVELVENFAKQAVIAIENARLLTELRESLQQQTATSEVLGVISASPGELAPVFDAMLENAVRICAADQGRLWRFEDGGFAPLAADGIPEALVAYRGQTRVLRPGPQHPLSVMVQTLRSVQEEDLSRSPDYLAGLPDAVAPVELGEIRTTLSVPMLKEGELIGAFTLDRKKVRPFEAKQVALVENFAAQAVIAIENARLLSELRESLDRQTASAEVLGVISSSPSDLRPVFDMVVKGALRLCGAEHGWLMLYDGEAFRVASMHGVPPAYAVFLRDETFRPIPESVFTQMLANNEPIAVADTTKIQAYRAGQAMTVAAVELAGARSALHVPMVKDNALIGTISIFRTEVRPFVAHHIEIVRNFANQAVIAIENARLLTELRESLERQTATSEVLGVISASPGELDPVFDVILDNALRLCDASQGQFFRIEDRRLYRLVTERGGTSAHEAFWRDNSALELVPGSPMCDAVERKTPIEIVDLRDLPAYRNRTTPALVASVDLLGSRSALLVPVLRDDEAIGVFIIWRTEVRAFEQNQIDVLVGFARQAAIAIENARLLDELNNRNRDLAESLDQQTASANILRAIASAPGEANEVLGEIAETARVLLRASGASITRLENGRAQRVAGVGLPTHAPNIVGEQLDRGSPSGRAVLDKATIHVADMASEHAEYPSSPEARGLVRTGTVLATPLLSKGEATGAIAVQRAEVRPFTDKEIDLLRGFADQAVIAIENARLLSELRSRTDDLGRTVGELRALGEVIQAVNSTLDLQTVLTTIVTNSVRLSQTDAGAIYVFDEDAALFHLRATFGMDEALIEAIAQQQIGLSTTGIGEAAAHRAPVQRADLAADPANFVTDILLKAGFRALLIIPLLGRDGIVGALVVRRRAPGEFLPSTIDLLQTFAAQSVVAIQNARLFQDIEEKSHELTVASQHKSQFLANMSHELRTPLNAILGYTELILDEIYGTTPGKMREVLLRIESNGKHLLGLINDVLDLSKIEAGQLTLTLGDFVVKNMLQSVYVAVEPLATRKNLKLKLDVPPGLPQAHGDERRLSQVVLNLVGNAIKFTDAGEVSIAAVCENDTFTISVRDTGPGIAQGDQAKIFEEFQQADNSITRKKGGTGLGLAISRRIIEMHGGRLWVDSTLGQGSTFSFTLPITADA